MSSISAMEMIPSSDGDASKSDVHSESSTKGPPKVPQSAPSCCLPLQVWYRIYKFSFRIRFGYFLLVDLVLVFFLAFSITLEMFFAVFLRSAIQVDTYYLRCTAAIVAVPFFAVFSSYIFDEISYLFIDCISSSPMCKLKLALISIWFHSQHQLSDIETHMRKLKLKKFYDTEDFDTISLEELPVGIPLLGDTPRDKYVIMVCDFVVPFLLELVPFIGVFLHATSIGEMGTSYLQYGSTTCACYCGVWLVLHLVVLTIPATRCFFRYYERVLGLITHESKQLSKQSFIDKHLYVDIGSSIGGLFGWLRTNTYHKLQCCKPTMPSSITSTSLSDSLIDDEILQKSTISQDDEKRPCFSLWCLLPYVAYSSYSSWAQQHPRLDCTVRYILNIFWVLFAVILSISDVINPNVCWFIFAVAIYLVGMKLRHEHFPTLLGHFYSFILGLYVVVAILCMLSTLLWPGATLTTYEGIQVLPAKSPKPPVSHYSAPYMACQLDYNGFSVLDMVLLSSLAYGNEQQRLDGLQRIFNNTEVGVPVIEYATNRPKTKETRFFSVFFPRQNTSIISITGTEDRNDVMEDAHYFLAIYTLQLIDRFIPILSSVSDTFVSQWITVLGINFFSTERPYDNLTAFVDRMVRTRTNRNILVTGHSLGGFMAGVLAAKFNIRGVGISSPGHLYNQQRFEYDADILRSNFLVIQPDHDIGPLADVQTGVVQHIKCPFSTILCHLTSPTSCELVKTCGDSKGRDFSERCKDFWKI